MLFKKKKIVERKGQKNRQENEQIVVDDQCILVLSDDLDLEAKS